MRRMKRLVAFAISVVALTFCFTGCDDSDHAHKWQYYVVKHADCTNKGLLEKLCEECGEKSYEDIQPSGHSFSEGHCRICGIAGNDYPSLNSFPIPTDANNDAKWSMAKIYDTAVAIGYPKDYQKFLADVGVSDYSIGEIYLDTLGFLHFYASAQLSEGTFEFPLSFLIGKVSPENPVENKSDVVQTIKIQDSEVMIFYADGTQIRAGTLTLEGVNAISGFGINVDDELVVYYVNNTIAFAGKVSRGRPPENKSLFGFAQQNGGYCISTLLDDEIEKITIPATHRGKPISSVVKGAFANNSNLKTIVVGANVLDFDSDLSKTSGCSVFFENAETEFRRCEGVSYYTYGQWEYVDGVPTPKI